MFIKKFFSILVSMLFILLIFNVGNNYVSSEGTDWYEIGGEWGYCKKITINHSLVDSDLTNFPILVHIVDDAELFSHAQVDGDDLIFVNSDNTSKFNHEIEYWNRDTSVDADIWVNITSLSGSVDTVIWMYYGNGGCGSQQNQKGTWDSNYVGVYHLNDKTGSSLNNDSTWNKDLTPTGSPNLNVSGKIANCVDFVPVDYLSSQTAVWLDYATITCEAWVRSDSPTTSDQRIVAGGASNTNKWVFVWDSTADNLHRGPVMTFGVPTTVGNNCHIAGTYTSVNWHYVTGIRTASWAAVYVNGTNVTGAGEDSFSLSATPFYGRIGSKDTTTYGFNGKIDEVRISNIKRSDSWISASYNTSNDPTSFLFFGVEEEKFVNTAPVITASSENPVNQSMGVGLGLVGNYSRFNISVSDVDDTVQDMNVTWYTNESGGWQVMGTNASVSNGTFYCSNVSWVDEYSHMYWWNVSVDDGYGGWDNDTYYFTTMANPSIVFTNSRKIIINHSYIESTLTNFPVLVYIPSSPDIASHTQPDGGDIAFFNDGNTTQFNHEIEEYNSSTGKLVCWVNVTSVSSVDDTVFWMKYGNDTCDNQENVTGTWDSGFEAVFHFNESDGNRLDSTSNNHYAMPYADVSRDNGLASGCVYFDGVTDHLETDVVDMGSDFTLEYFFMDDSITGTNYEYHYSQNVYSATNSYNIFTDSRAGHEGTLYDLIDDGVVGSSDTFSLSGNVVDGDWHYYHCAITDAVGYHHYLDLIDEGTAASSPVIDYHIHIGGREDNNSDRFYEGDIDEMRISTVVRSSAWMNATYYSIMHPIDFMVIETEFTQPVVTTNMSSDVTNTSVKLYGYVSDTGGEDCSVWFDYDDYNLSECVGVIATGDVCYDNWSILWKNRHSSASNNQKVWYFEGTNYSFWGVGIDGDAGGDHYCRQGQNEKGLTAAYYVMGGEQIVSPTFSSDGSYGDFDNNLRVVLGNYSTVADAAYALANHAYYGGGVGVVLTSGEWGVGALVEIDTTGDSKIKWVNNTYEVYANACQVNGKEDVDGTEARARELIVDIIDNGTGFHGDKLCVEDLMNISRDDKNGRLLSPLWYDVGDNGIAFNECEASMIAISGKNYSVFDDEGCFFMAWNSIGYTEVAPYLPLYAGLLESQDDIPANWTNSTYNSNHGLSAFVDVKDAYCRNGATNDTYYKPRVLEVLGYTQMNDNMTIQEWDSLMDGIGTCANVSELRGRLEVYANDTMVAALKAYVGSGTDYFVGSSKMYPQGVGEFNQTITDLKPGIVYWYRAGVNNSVYSNSGSTLFFMTLPDKPYDVGNSSVGTGYVNLSWYKGSGAFYTVIERNTTESWVRGEGVEVYNGTGNFFNDTGLNGGTVYYYQLWSYTVDMGEHAYSSDYASYDTTTTGEAPSQTYQGDYLIITNSTLYSGFDDFIRWKTWQGYNVTIANVTDFIGNSSFWVDGYWGDASNDTNPWMIGYPNVTTYSRFNDTQAKIRNYIRYQVYNNSIDYVLLGGDRQFVHIRYTNYYDDWPLYNGYSDNYYSCLNGSLNEDEDSHWAEYQEGEFDIYNRDWYHDVLVGRIPSNSDNDIENFTVKTETYVNSSGEWLFNETFIRGYDWTTGGWSYNFNNLFSSYYFDEFYSNFDCFKEVPYGDSDRTHLINNINNGQNIVCYDGHSSNVDIGWAGGLMNSTYASLFENSNHPFLAIWTGCHMGKLDDEINHASYLINSRNGSFAFISTGMSVSWFESILNETIHIFVHSNETIRSALALAYENLTSELILFYGWHEMGVFYGDPSVSYNMNISIAQSPKIINENPEDGSDNIGSNPTLSVDVSDWEGDELNIYFYTNATGSWGLIDSNLSVYNGTYSQTNDSMDSDDTMYWWSVNVTDGTYWTNETYNYFARFDGTPLVTDFYPVEDTYNPIMITYISFNVTNDDVHDIYGTVWSVETSPDVGSKSNAGSSWWNWSVSNNGTKKVYFKENLEYNTSYTVYINVSDAYWTSYQTYHNDGNLREYVFVFHTTNNSAPIVSEENPINGSTDNYLNPILQIMGDDFYGGNINVTFRTNASGSWQDIDYNDSELNYKYLTLRPTCNDTIHSLDYIPYNPFDFTVPSGGSNETHYTYLNDDNDDTYLKTEYGQTAYTDYIEGYGIDGIYNATINSVTLYCRGRFNGTVQVADGFRGFLSSNDSTDLTDWWTTSVSTDYCTSETFTSVNKTFTTNPFTGGIWTGSYLEDLKIGVYYSASIEPSSEEPECWISELYLIINYTNATGIYQQISTTMNSYDTTYYWSVNITDGELWTNETYDFTTGSNNPPVVSNENPANASSGISLEPTLSITVDDTNQFDVIFRTNASGNWETIEEYTNQYSGTFHTTNTSNMNQSLTTYYWSVNCSDGSNWVNETYHFTTKLDLFSYDYYKRITINHSLIDCNLVNFPILISIDSDSDLNSHAQPDGDDIIFVNSDNTSKFNHEIEYYSSGTLIAWVNITSLSSSSDTIIYMRYGDASCGPQENHEGTWSSDYLMVHHFNETSLLTGNDIFDSTRNNNDGTAVNMEDADMDVNGIIGSGVYVDGVNEYLNIPDDGTNNDLESGDYTVLVCVSQESGGDSWNPVIAKGTWNGANDFLLYDYNSGSKGHMTFRNSNDYCPFSYSTIEDTGWHMLTLTYDSGVFKSYLDSVYANTLNLVHTVSNTYSWMFGSRSDLSYNYKGYIDEIQILKGTAVDYCWINATYDMIENQNDFISVGSEQQQEEITYMCINLNTSEEFTNLTNAIDDSDTVNGNIIQVYEGFWNVTDTILVDKELTIQGYSASNTTLCSNPSSNSMFEIIVNNTVIQNLNLTNSTSSYGLITMNYHSYTIENVNISNNIFYNNKIIADFEAHTNINNIVFDNNTIYGYDGGGSVFAIVFHHSDNISITNCNLYNTSYYGIFDIEYGNNAIIMDCVFNNCSVNDVAIQLFPMDIVDISNISFIGGNLGYMFYVDDDSSYINITNCSGLPLSCTYGVELVDCNNITINNNVFANCTYGIYFAGQSDDVLVYNNNFSDNTQNVDTTGWTGNNLSWNLTTPLLGTNIIGGSYLGGNYWDDYAGVDTDGDGLGNTLVPYDCSGNIVSGGDYHPLTNNLWSISIPTNVESINGLNYINISWTKGVNATHTIVERNQTDITVWDRGTGIEIYNDTGTYYNDTSLVSGITYYYQLWSYNDTTYQYSSDNVSVSNTTTIIGIDCELNTTTWIIGEIGVGDSATKNFTFYQNGSLTIDIMIGVNCTNYTFVTYTDWMTLGHDRYCANYTIDNWVSEANINLGYPPTTVLKNSFSPGSFNFGVRIWMPRTVTYSNVQETFEISLTVSEST